MRVHIRRGIDCVNSGDLGTAVDEFKWAISIEPERPAAHFLLGFALLRQGKYRSAFLSLKLGTPHNPAAAKKGMDHCTEEMKKAPAMLKKTRVTVCARQGCGKLHAKLQCSEARSLEWLNASECRAVVVHTWRSCSWLLTQFFRNSLEPLPGQPL